MKKLCFLLLASMLILPVACERNDNALKESTNNPINELEKQSESTAGKPGINFAPEYVDPKDITPPRR